MRCGLLNEAEAQEFFEVVVERSRPNLVLAARLPDHLEHGRFWCKLSQK